jgi:hypothetical protein
LKCRKDSLAEKESEQLSLLFTLIITLLRLTTFTGLTLASVLYVFIVDSESLVNLGAKCILILNAKKESVRIVIDRNFMKLTD